MPGQLERVEVDVAPGEVLITVAERLHEEGVADRDGGGIADREVGEDLGINRDRTIGIVLADRRLETLDQSGNLGVGEIRLVIEFASLARGLHVLR